MRFSMLILILVTVLFLQPPILSGQDMNESPSAEAQQAKPTQDIKTISSITVAIIDFESKAPGNPDLGRQLGDILTARMSVYDQFRLVERKRLEDILKEHQLSLSGLADTGQVVKVGKMAGARIMVFGSVFPVDHELYIVAKIVGTETSQVKGIIAKGKLESNLSDIIDQLVEKLADGLEKWAPELLPKTENFQNKVDVLKKKLEGEKLPTVSVMIPEVHVNRQIADPAAETEMKKIFREVGFEVIETDKKTLEKWAKDYSMEGVDIVITGEGFSELGTRIGGLTGCIARLEVQATDRADHNIIISERTTRRAVDLAEGIAAKTALQAAGRELAIKTIEKITEELTGEETKSENQ